MLEVAGADAERENIKKHWILNDQHEDISLQSGDSDSMRLHAATSHNSHISTQWSRKKHIIFCV